MDDRECISFRDGVCPNPQDWLAACGGGCKYDFVPYHFYGTDANQLIEYTKDFYNTYKKPLWLTEVGNVIIMPWQLLILTGCVPRLWYGHRLQRPTSPHIHEHLLHLGSLG